MVGEFLLIVLHFMSYSDAGRVQVRSHPKEDSEGEARHAPAVRAEATQDADEVSGTSVEEVQHEDHECDIHQGPTQAQ